MFMGVIACQHWGLSPKTCNSICLPRWTNREQFQAEEHLPQQVLWWTPEETRVSCLTPNHSLNAGSPQCLGVTQTVAIPGSSYPARPAPTWWGAVLTCSRKGLASQWSHQERAVRQGIWQTLRHSKVSGGDIFVDIKKGRCKLEHWAWGRATSPLTELLPRQRQVTAELGSGRWHHCNFGQACQAEILQQMGKQH